MSRHLSTMHDRSNIVRGILYYGDLTYPDDIREQKPGRPRFSIGPTATSAWTRKHVEGGSYTKLLIVIACSNNVRAPREVIDPQILTIHARQIIDTRLEFLRLPGDDLKFINIPQRSCTNPEISISLSMTSTVPS